ncbi:MAG: UTRA domain-containing protein [Nocardioidaceae bacterium]
MSRSGSIVARIERVRLLNGLPVALDCSLVAVGNSPELVDCDFETASLRRAPGSAGVMPTFAEHIGSYAAVGGVAEPLELADGEPVLVSRQITYDQNSQRFESGRIYYRKDRYRLRTTLLASPGGRPGDHSGLIWRATAG